MRRPLLIVGLALAVAIAAPGASAAAAATPGGATLDTKRDPTLWTGQVTRGQPASNEVPECSATACDEFRLRVDLPKNAWKHREGGVEVSIRWFGTFGDNLRLYVYRRGSLVAKSDGIIASAQSVLIPSAADGRYKVYVAFDPDSISDQVAYEGLAEVEYEPRPHPRRLLLPDLVSLSQRNVTFETPLDFGFEPPPAPGDSCFGSEKAEEGASTCLRFDQVFANTGEGPLELRFALPRDPASAESTVFQRIYRSTGKPAYQDRPAGEWEYHPIHDHFHFKSFGVSRLWATNGGQRAGSAPLRSSRKVSFCIVDIEIHAWAEKGNGPRSFSFPACVTPADGDESNDYLIQGMSAGWADVYDWFLPDQYVEVTGVPDGTYILDTLADPDNAIRERDESNNCASAYVQLAGMGTAAPQAQLLGPGPRC
jgi:Lysyl oxidase